MEGSTQNSKIPGASYIIDKYNHQIFKIFNNPFENKVFYRICEVMQNLPNYRISDNIQIYFEENNNIIEIKFDKNDYILADFYLSI